LTAARFRRDLTVIVDEHQAAGGAGDPVQGAAPDQGRLRRDLLVVYHDDIELTIRRR
jgi:hypothetical protein